MVERSPIPIRIIRTLREKRVTVLPAVPPLWLQLLGSPAFRAEPLEDLRIMTNTGGRIPTPAVAELLASQPSARLFLMYGLTEAFRSTYLDPSLAATKPGSIGQAIPGAEVIVLGEDGTEAATGEVGELVHRGPTVALGYWDDLEATRLRYGPNPLRPAGAPPTEQVVHSGDLVYRDEDGDLFFVGRRDKMIKTLGYRVSPDEVVDVLHASGEIREAVVTAEPDSTAGSRIVAYVVLVDGGDVDRLWAFVGRELPHYLQPGRIEVRSRARSDLQRQTRPKRYCPRSPMISHELEDLLEPLEQFESIRRQAVKLGPRLADLSYANPYDGPQAAARATIRAALDEERSLDLQYTPFGGQTLARRAVADHLRLMTGRPYVFSDVILDARCDGGASAGAASHRRASGGRRHPGPMLAGLPALRAVIGHATGHGSPVSTPVRPRRRRHRSRGHGSDLRRAAVTSCQPDRSGLRLR